MIWEAFILFLFINLCFTHFVIGLFSNIMREQANISGDQPKWIVLDGDIDPMWIESLNTVMDDNKVVGLFLVIMEHFRWSNGLKSRRS